MKFQTNDGVWHNEHDLGGAPFTRRFAQAICGKRISTGPVFLKKLVTRRADHETGGKECPDCKRHADAVGKKRASPTARAPRP
jgi:hypothetical protein